MTKSPRGGGEKPGQLSLAFPEREPAFEDLLVTSVNEGAIGVLRQPDSWPFPVICVVGPRRSGLTALAKAWSREFDGRYVSAKKLSKMKAKKLTALGGGYVAVDDADDACNPRIPCWGAWGACTRCRRRRPSVEGPTRESSGSPVTG